MLPDPQDTIVALSTAPGPGGRAIVRLSGLAALRLACSVFAPAEAIDASKRRCYSGACRLPGVAAPLPADLYAWPAPHAYTGQEMAELHVVSCSPLVDLLASQLLAAGARAAQPGEFTLRAFLAGKLDLTKVEAVLGVIEAGSRDELRVALGQLAGGVARPLQELRNDLLDLLADVEAGLDFAEEDVKFVAQTDLLNRLSKGLALVTLLGKQLDQRALGERPFRVVLAGRPNAGKSSLFNALGGRALVSALPGTTRDYLVCTLEVGGARIELVDTAGWQAADGGIVGQAQALRREQTQQADLVLLCVGAGRDRMPEEEVLLRQATPPVVGVATKCDVGEPSPGLLATSARNRTGLSELKALLAERARAQARPAMAPSLSRCRHHVDSCLQCLRRAHHAVLFSDPPEILALELRSALDQLGEMVGAVYTDDLLDRIFSRFCIGK
ncbi:MAG TPA: tRNA modification GTPase [Gemmataceae bacterium]|nr:tRNA modification GTPase [Gemmataceae bacterium]